MKHSTRTMFLVALLSLAGFTQGCYLIGWMQAKDELERQRQFQAEQDVYRRKLAAENERSSAEAFAKNVDGLELSYREVRSRIDLVAASVDGWLSRNRKNGRLMSRPETVAAVKLCTASRSDLKKLDAEHDQLMKDRTGAATPDAYVRFKDAHGGHRTRLDAIESSLRTCRDELHAVQPRAGL